MCNKGISLRLDDSLISSVLGLKVTPKKVIRLFLILFFNNFLILIDKILCLSSLDYTVELIIDRLVLNFFPVAKSAFVSLGKHEPP